MNEISESDKKRNLESTLYLLNKLYPYYSAILSEIDIIYTIEWKTLCLSFNKKSKEFCIYINPYFFHSLSKEEKVAVLYHEILHFTHGHVFRIQLRETLNNEKDLYNIAADMAINQFISNLPKGVVSHKSFVTKKGLPFPDFLTYEQYYDLLNQSREENKGVISKFIPLDDHDFDALSEEDYEAMLRKGQIVIKRSMEKNKGMTFGDGNGFASLEEFLENQLKHINYKYILKHAIKRSLNSSRRESTWTKPNKRYKQYAPGYKNGKDPFIQIFIDTSGSVSIPEINGFFHFFNGIINETHLCYLGLFHEHLYSYKKYNKKLDIKDILTQSGGTDLVDVINKINKSNADLTIILTDGYYGPGAHCDKQNIFWILTQKGEHALSHIGKTIYLEGLI